MSDKVTTKGCVRASHVALSCRVTVLLHLERAGLGARLQGASSRAER